MFLFIFLLILEPVLGTIINILTPYTVNPHWLMQAWCTKNIKHIFRNFMFYVIRLSISN